ncbi:MAG TPA: YceI family protein [Steroidobacteraceae bacterium]|nr:YceI family protein [Steroidobacteraceae bacterium]
MTLRTHVPALGCALLALASVCGASPATYRLDPAHSTLSFAFTQAGAKNQGRFGKFDVTLMFDAAAPQSGKLDVTVQVTSLDTGDQERDSTLRGADLFDVAKFAQAHFSAATLNRIDATRFEAVGKLTIRDQTHDLRVPLTLTTSATGTARGATLAGQVTIHRLDYGVGQGDWKSTEWVGNDVVVSFNLRLAG